MHPLGAGTSDVIFDMGFSRQTTVIFCKGIGALYQKIEEAIASSVVLKLIEDATSMNLFLKN